MTPAVASSVAERFVTYEYVADWPELISAVYETEIRLRSSGRPVAADILLRAFGVLQRELLELGRQMAAFATAELERQEKKTRVRPDTEGGGGPRLGNHLKAEPIEQNIMPGAIGVADLDLLNSLEDEYGNTGWWITNEIGSSGRVGGRLFGTFYGSSSAAPPDSDLFREHPLFASGPNESLAGLGFISNPIPARHFIEKAQRVIAAEWRLRFEAVKGRFGVEMQRALVMPR